MAWPGLTHMACLFAGLMAQPGVAPAPDSAAMQSFHSLVDTLRAAPPSRIESALVLEARLGKVIETSEALDSIYVLYPPGRGFLRLREFRITVDQQSIWFEHGSSPDAYVRLDRGESPIEVLRSEFHSMPDPLLGIVLGAGGKESLLSTLDDEGCDYVPVSVEAGSEEGEETIDLECPSARLQLTWDPSRGELLAATLDRRGGPSLPEGVLLRSNWTYETAALDKDEAIEALRFKRGDRHRLLSPAALTAHARAGEGEGPVAVGADAPPLELVSDEGRMVRLADLRGEVVVIDFWASWCGPCRRALPQLQRLADAYERAERPVRFLAVNVFERVPGMDRAEIVKRVRKATGLRLPVLLDLEDQAAKAWGVTGIPATFVIDPKGRISARFGGFGPGSIEELKQAIDAAAKE